MTKIRVLIVEDEPLIAREIAACLENVDFQVVGTARSGEQALDLLANRNPDIALLDINLKGSMDGIEVAKIINKNYKIPFVYLTSYSDRNTVEMLKPTLPAGYIVKPFDEGDLLTSVEIAVFNFAQKNKSSELNHDVLNEKLNRKLTNREFELLNALYDGKTNKQMADSMFISVNTIKTHLKNLFEKLDVRSRSAATAKIRDIMA